LVVGLALPPELAWRDASFALENVLPKLDADGFVVLVNRVKERTRIAVPRVPRDLPPRFVGECDLSAAIHHARSTAVKVSQSALAD
jgi:hypothetical protein